MEKINSLLLTISTTPDGPEKMRMIKNLNTLYTSLEKEEENKRKDVEKKKELEIRQKEDIKLNKYKQLFEKRMKDFSYVCPSCGSLCKYDIMEGRKGYLKQSFLFCTDKSCYNSNNRKYDPDFDDTIGIDEKSCERKIVFN